MVHSNNWESKEVREASAHLWNVEYRQQLQPSVNAMYCYHLFVIFIMYT